MNILFVHNNFPGQFKNIVLRLRGLSGIRLAAIGAETAADMSGVELRRYGAEGPSADCHAFARRFDAECRRAEQVMFAAGSLASSGFTPDLIVGHCGWGETLPLKSVFPKARMAIYCEFFYRAEGQDVDFEPELSRFGVDGLSALNCKNASTLIALSECDVGLSPTRWQRSTYPREFQSKIRVAHEGVDTNRIRPDATAKFVLPGGRRLTRADEVVTFAARSLEPMRGFHKFLDAVPEILERRPNAQIIIVGAEEPSYGPYAPDGGDWKAFCLRKALPRLDLARVHFLDRLPHDRLLALMQISSAHVYLTYPFVLSWSLIEAMAAGCTIVASDTTPLHEVITDGESGLLVPFHDASAIADAVARVLADAKGYTHLGTAARQVAVERFDAADCVDRALEALGISFADGGEGLRLDRAAVQ